MSLKWPDYLVLVGFLVISMAIGLYHSLTGGRQKTTAEFIMADRKLKVLPTAISLLVSYQSAIAILGFPMEIYSYGTQQLILSAVGCTLSAVIVERIFVPWLYPLKLVSINEYVYMRFGSQLVKLFTSIAGIVSGILYMGIAMYAPSSALASVAKFPLQLSIALMSLVCITYTALGGMRAVIWTDVFQCIIMFGGMIAIVIKGMLFAGGFGNVINSAFEEGRWMVADWNPDPTVRHTFWGIVIGGSIAGVPVYGLSQAAVQRFSATKNLTQARMVILLSIPGNVLMIAIAGLTGLVVLAYYSKIHCDPVKNKDIQKEIELLPHFVMDLFGNVPGFAGLFLATLYGGALSSVSSALSGSAANFWEDVLKRKLGHLSELKQAIINRVLVIAFGLIATLVSFLAHFLPGPITQISSTLCGSVTSSILGIFLLGGISKLVNWKGALVGGIVGMALNLWFVFGAMTVPNMYPTLPPVSVDGCSQNSNSTFMTTLHGDNHYEAVTMATESMSTTAFEMDWTPKHQGLSRFYCLSYMWYVLLGSLTTAVVGIVVSLITRDREAENAVEDRLLIKFRNIISCSSLGDKDISDSEKHVNIDAINSQSRDEPRLQNVTRF